jgi:hypothetical protein
MATMLTEGARVRLNQTSQPGKWEPKEFHGRAGTFLGASRPHGYARVQFDGFPVPVLVHPESLTVEVAP